MTESSNGAPAQDGRDGRTPPAPQSTTAHAAASGTADESISLAIASDAATKRTRTRRKVGAIWIVAIVTVLVLGVGLYAFNVWSSLSDIQRLDDALASDYEGRPEPVTPTSDGRAPLNILLLGSDTRASGQDLMTSLGERADAIMVAHIPADRASVQIMSIMRDSWVPIDGHGDGKINWAYSLGSMPLMTQEVEQLIGQRIDHVAIIDFESFKGMTDALGGVTINNPIPFSSWHMPGHMFEQGEITLNGEEALAFVGERYAFIDGDYQRVKNQQLYLQALFEQVRSQETVMNPMTVANLVSTVSPFVTVDAALTNQAITSLALELRDVQRDDVTFFTMPTSGTGLIGNQSVVFVDWVKLEQVRAGFADDTLTQLGL